MAFQPTPLVVLLATASLMSFGLGGYVFYRYLDRNRTLVVPFFGIALSGGWWSLTYALQLSSTTLQAKLFWNRLVWIGSAGLMIAWPAFVLVYTGRERWVRPVRLALLSVAPALIVAAAWSGESTTLLYLDATVESHGGSTLMTFRAGPLLVWVIAYSYVVNLVTYVLLWPMFTRRTGPVRRQAGLLLLAGVIPTAAGFLGNLGLVVPRFVDLTPVAFTVTVPIIAWALFGHRLLDVSPIPRDALFADLPIGMVVITDDGLILDANDVALSLFGEQVVGSEFTDAFGGYPDVVSVIEEDPKETKTEVTVETSGGLRSVEVTAVSAAPAQRRGIDTVLLLQDVTERQQYERRYRTLIEKSPNVIVTLDEDWVLQYVSSSVERILGYDLDEIAGRSVLELVHPDDRDEVAAFLDRASDGDGAGRIEHRIRHSDGTWYRFRTNVEPLPEGEDEVVAVGTDVTDQREYEQRLQVLNRVLRHDLKNRVNVIQGYVDLLEDHADSEGRRHLEMIDREAANLSNLSDLAREIDVALHTDPDLRRVDVTDAVRETTDSLRAAYDDVTVDVTLPDEATATVDPLYRSALENVMGNAVEHNDRPEPTVEVTVERGADSVDVIVADDGPGIPPNQLEVLRSEEETPLEHANGLGLWLVDWIVSRAGGTLEFEDNDPRGTVVRLCFPRENEDRAAHAEPSEPFK